MLEQGNWGWRDHLSSGKAAQDPLAPETGEPPPGNTTIMYTYCSIAAGWLLCLEICRQPHTPAFGHPSRGETAASASLNRAGFDSA